MGLKPYGKVHASVHQRIAHLQSKGLIVPRPSVAAKKIEIIGYERLRIYFLSRRQLAVPGRPFVPNTLCQDIIRLYECDSRIRDACFAAVGQFEILFRNSLSEILSRSHGSHPYFNVAAFKDAACNLDAARMFADVYQRNL